MNQSTSEPVPAALLPDEELLPPKPLERKQLLWGMFTVSLASLLLELALTRLFSVVLFYHFAFLAISIALLGLGAGGVFAYVRKQYLERWRTGPLAARLCVLNAVAIVLVLEVVLRLPVSLELSKWNFLKLTVIYLVSAVPFFFTGVLFSVVFAREAKTIGMLYGADLIGGAMACLAVVPLLNLVGGPNTVLAAAIVMAVAGQVWSTRREGMRHVANGLVTLLVILLAANYSGKLIDIKYAKGMRRDQPWMEWARWNAISRVEVNKQGTGKVIVIDADAQTAIMNTDPYSWDPVYRRDLMAAAPAVANVLRPTGDYAIIGPGGGVDVLRAVANGSKNVTGIEINPLIANRIMRGEYADYAHHLYEIPEVHIHVADGRSWIRNSKDRYDVIQMTLVDTWASTAAGAYALSENNLYTVEAFKEYFDHLKGDGIIAITRWEFRQPREALRVVAQEIEVLRHWDPQNLGLHFMVISDGELDTDGRAVTVLAKKSAFTFDEEHVVFEYLRAHPNLRCIYCLEGVEYNIATRKFTPEINEDVRKTFGIPREQLAFAELIASRDPKEFARTYPYNITPVTDNAPFFFFTIKTKDVLKGIFGGTGKGMDWRINLGSVVLFMLLGISAAAVVGFLILPLALYKPARLHGTRGLWYFVAVGLGYILVEIAFIQRFVLFLGHPTYALTVVVFLMLLSSGAGSIVARRWMSGSDPRRVRWALGAVVAAIALYLFVLPPMLTSLVGLDFGVKLALTALVLVPLGFAMGMPFPTGLQVVAFAGEDGAATEWAWAMNAASSVFGSVLAMVIAIHFGLGVTLGCGAAAYLAALMLTRRWSPTTA